MNISNNDLTLALSPSLELQNTESQEPSQPPESGQGGILDTMLLPMMMCVVVFWFIVVRPEKKNRKAREAMLEGLTKGDPVVTSGGIHGTVAAIKDDVVTIQVADGVRLRFSVHAVQSLETKPTAEEKAS